MEVILAAREELQLRRTPKGREHRRGCCGTGPLRRCLSLPSPRLDELMSYYPDHVYLQSSSTPSSNPSLRRCSVKGCAKDLSPDYPLKMCETCRCRHRKYATTKRAKRKQEKAAVGAQRIANDDGQIVTWMPQNHHVALGPTPEDLDPVPVRFKLSLIPSHLY